MSVKVTGGAGSLARTTSLPGIVAGSFTITFWAKLTTDQGGNWGVWLAINGSGGTWVWQSYTTEISFGPLTTWGTWFDSDFRTKWVFLALVGDGTAKKINISARQDADAAMTSLGSITATSIGTFTSVSLLQDQFGDHVGAGQITSYKEWSSNLTTAQILAESKNRAPVVTSGNTCYLPFTSASGTDNSGAGHDFTITGTITADASEPSSMTSSSPISGTGAATEPGLTGAGTGGMVDAGTGAATEPGLAGAGSGGMALPGTGAPSEPGLVAAGAGTMALSGSGAAAEPGLVAAGAGTEVIAGAGAATLPEEVPAGTGGLAITGTGAGVLPGQTGANVPTIGGSGNPVLPGLAASGAGTETIAGSGAAALPGLGASGLESTPPNSGSGAAALPGKVASGAGHLAIVGAGSPVLPGLVAAASDATLVPIGGTGAATLPGLRASGAESSRVRPRTRAAALLMVAAAGKR